MTIFLGSTTCFFSAKFMLTVSHNHGNPIIYKCMEIKYMKSLNYVLNQNVNVTKRERFATFAVSIVDNYLCLLLQQHK